jgi:EpsI family protein
LSGRLSSAGLGAKHFDRFSPILNRWHSPMRQPLNSRTYTPWIAGLAALCGAVIFHVFGNATRGYIDTPSLFIWWGRQWFDARSETQHGPLLLLTALWLLWRNLKRADRKSESTTRRDIAVGTSTLVAALAMHALGFALQQPRISIFALLVFVWGVCRLAGGKRLGDAAIFPLGLLLLAMPLGFLESLGFYLRLAVSVTAEKLCSMAGLEIVRNGTQLFSPDGRFQYDVAAACSGIRSLVALFALGFVIAYLNFRSIWARAAVAALTFPLAYLGNAVRILAIVAAGHIWGHSAGARVHDYSGVVVFLIVLGALLAGVAAFQRLRQGAKPAHSRSDEPRLEVSLQPGAASLFTCTAAILIASGATAWSIREMQARPMAPTAPVLLATNGIDPVALPEFLGTEWIGQRVDVSQVEREILPPDTGYSRRNYVSVADRAHQVFLSVVLSGKDRSSLHRPELCIVGQGWSIEQERTVSLPISGGSLPATLLQLRRDVTDAAGNRRTVRHILVYWFTSRAEVVASHREMLWRNAVARVKTLNAERWAYVIAQTPLDGPEDAALGRVAEVVSQAWPAIAPAGLAADNRAAMAR